MSLSESRGVQMSLSESKESNVVSRSKDDSKDKKYHHLGSKDNVRGQHPSVIEKRAVGVIVNFSCDLCVVSQPNDLGKNF